MQKCLCKHVIHLYIQLLQCTCINLYYYTEDDVYITLFFDSLSSHYVINNLNKKKLSLSSLNKSFILDSLSSHYKIYPPLAKNLSLPFLNKSFRTKTRFF